jgi:DNA-binding MarR family transcriptional regulator/GNAT superfamily N-acetyltransferase
MDRLLARVRSFNRTVAEEIGAVGDRFLGRGRAIGASRILWEIGTAGVEVRSLRARLGLDSGYTTRVLQSLARERLVRVEIDRGDRRVRRVILTARGLAERAELDRRSDDLAGRILAPLDDVQRGDLVDAMARVEKLLRQSMVRFTVESPHTRDARSCLKRYFAELDARFEKGFDPRVSISADAQELTPPAGLLIVVRMGGRPVGCGAIKFHGKAPAELKRMWIDTAARGSGLGLRLLRELERQAREAGVRALRLETNRALKEAIALYRRAGYTEVRPFNDEPYAHHWFEKRLAAGRTPRAAAKRSR